MKIVSPVTTAASPSPVEKLARRRRREPVEDAAQPAGRLARRDAPFAAIHVGAHVAGLQRHRRHAARPPRRLERAQPVVRRELRERVRADRYKLALAHEVVTRRLVAKAWRRRQLSRALVPRSLVRTAMRGLLLRITAGISDEITANGASALMRRCSSYAPRLTPALCTSRSIVLASNSRASAASCVELRTSSERTLTPGTRASSPGDCASRTVPNARVRRVRARQLEADPAAGADDQHRRQAHRAAHSHTSQRSPDTRPRCEGDRLARCSRTSRRTSRRSACLRSRAR